MLDDSSVISLRLRQQLVQKQTHETKQKKWKNKKQALQKYYFEVLNSGTLNYASAGPA